MFNRSVKKSRVEITTPEFQFGRSLRIIEELDINDIVILNVYSRAIYKGRVLFINNNTLRVEVE